jgi:heme-degrading monooxygenase HmoA
MIARTWRGRVPAAKATEYHEFLLRSGVPDYQATPGNRGVLMQRRIEGGDAHFVLTTIWDSVESIKKFAGEDYEKARYYPQDDDYLLARHVRHARGGSGAGRLRHVVASTVVLQEQCAGRRVDRRA